MKQKTVMTLTYYIKYEAADKYNIQSNTLYQYLSGRRKNKTTLKYLNYE